MKRLTAISAIAWIISASAVHAALSSPASECQKIKEPTKRLACYDAAFNTDPLFNKTIVPRAGFGNQFNKFWITPQGRVIWFFVSGSANEGIISNLGEGVTQGTTVLQYDPSGQVVDYANYKGRIVRVTAPYLARATSDGVGTLNFSYSFSASHTTKGRVKVEEMEMTTLKVDISANECLISGSSSNTVRRNGKIVQNNSQDLPANKCTVADGNN